MSSNEYMKTYMLKRYHKKRKEAFDILGNKCAYCKSTKDLQIDHIDPSKKSFTLSKMWSIACERFLNELMKCQLLCLPCHKEKNLGEFKGPWNANSNPKHGTGAKYGKGCRCSKCNLWRKHYRKGLRKYDGSLA